MHLDSTYTAQGKDEARTIYEKARAHKERLITKLFYFMAELLGIFLIPAVIAALISKNFNITPWILLPVAFILSWTVAFFRYKKYAGPVKSADATFRIALREYRRLCPDEVSANERALQERIGEEDKDN